MILALLLHAVSLEGTAPLPPSGPAAERGTVLVQNFFSPALGARKRYLIYLPRSYAKETRRRYPVGYLLHGYTGNEADWVSRGDLDVVADSVFGKQDPELILVMPDGDNSFWANWTESPGYGACAQDSSLAEAAGSFCVPFSRYGDYIAQDLVAHVDSTYRTLADRAHRGLLGLSMGGTGALTLAFTYPEVFTATVAISAVAAPLYLGPHPYAAPARQAKSLDGLEQSLGRKLTPQTRARWGNDTTLWWRYDPARAARRVQESGGQLPTIRLDAGWDDPYIDQNRALHAGLAELAVPHEFLEREGRHDWAYWRMHGGETLVWLSRRLITRRPGGG